ncbi:unnamed protein product [Ectocarpus sp. 12 AP-2014]
MLTLVISWSSTRPSIVAAKVPKVRRQGLVNANMPRHTTGDWNMYVLGARAEGEGHAPEIRVDAALAKVSSTGVSLALRTGCIGGVFLSYRNIEESPELTAKGAHWCSSRRPASL